tara:strand:+ start:3040 stop:3585 length:546 start_codon:yes stop_codon:yes gene_type:complete
MAFAAPAIPYVVGAMAVSQYQQQGAMGKANQASYNAKGEALDNAATQIEKQKDFDILQFNKEFTKLVGTETVAFAKSGVTREGSALRIARQNAEEAQLQRNTITYNSKIAANQKRYEADTARFQGRMARAAAKQAQIKTITSAATSFYTMGQGSGAGSSLLGGQQSFGGEYGGITGGSFGE